MRPRGRMVMSARLHLVLPQVTSKRAVQCVQVTDAPRPSSDRPSIRPKTST
jgi:hypothetical protein